jgi:hypothetical protein
MTHDAKLVLARGLVALINRADSRRTPPEVTTRTDLDGTRERDPGQATVCPFDEGSSRAVPGVASEALFRDWESSFNP